MVALLYFTYVKFHGVPKENRVNFVVVFVGVRSSFIVSLIKFTYSLSNRKEVFSIWIENAPNIY